MKKFYYLLCILLTSFSHINAMDMLQRKKRKRSTITSEMTTIIMAKRNKKEWPCTYENCSKKYFYQGSLKRHIDSIHKGIKHPCPYCSHQATTTGSLKRHIDSIHNGIKHPCPYCSHQATTKSHLNTHIDSIHKGIKYPCPYCSYQATTIGGLKKHIDSIRKGIKHPCPYCSYQATTTGGLKRHIKNKHTVKQGKMTSNKDPHDDLDKKENINDDEWQQYLNLEYFK